MSNASAYYQTYGRALHKYVTNGFFTRDLDADDWAFIEGIREHGRVACGSLGLPAPTHCTHSDDVLHRPSLEEEHEFWRAPSDLYAAALRRVGPVVKTLPRAAGATPGAIKRAQAAVHNRKVRAEMEKAMAEEWRRANRQQLDRAEQMARDDAEWEAAAPTKDFNGLSDRGGLIVPVEPFDLSDLRRRAYRRQHPAFGGVKGRHYVPQWKIADAEERRQERRAKRLALAERRTFKHQQAKQDCLLVLRARAAECRRMRQLSARLDVERAAAKRYELSCRQRPCRAKPERLARFNGDWKGLTPAQTAWCIREAFPDTSTYKTLTELAKQTGLALGRISSAMMKFYETYGDHTPRFIHISDYRCRRNAYYADALVRYRNAGYEITSCLPPSPAGPACSASAVASAEPA
jgi:hypothetical protein